jgi:hypothetical protein
MQRMTPESLVIRGRGDDGVVSRRFGSQTLLVPVSSGVGDLDSVYTLNEVGSTVWHAAEQPTTLARLIAAVVEEYDVPPEQAASDVAAFLSELAQAGLVRMDGAGA